MTRNNGITLITLVIMIVVILILTSVFIATGIDALNESKNSEIANEIYQIEQAIAEKYVSYMKNDGNIALTGSAPSSKWTTMDECVDAVLLTLDFEDVSFEDKTMKVQKINNDFTRDYDKFVKILYSGDMAKLGLENFSDDNVYVVNYYTGSVYGPIND